MIDTKIGEDSDGQLRIEVVRFRREDDGTLTEVDRNVVAEQDADGVWHDADHPDDIEAHEEPEPGDNDGYHGYENNERYLPETAHEPAGF